MSIINLTAAFVATQLQCPEGKSRVEFCDSELPGLYVEVRSNNPGQGTYYWRYKDATGKTCHQKIGRTTEITLVEARRKAKQLKAEISLGADPRGAAKAQKAVVTVAQLFEDHYLPYVRQRKRSWKTDGEMYRNHLRDRFGHLRLNQLSRVQIQRFHSDLLTGGLAPATCDHQIKMLRHALNLAIDWDLLDVNPAAGVPLFNTDNKVEHYMDDVELEQLLTVLRTDHRRSVCQIAMFLLSTGCRLNEALCATWDQVDIPNRVWRIPALNSKSKRVRSVPLNDSAIDVLGQLQTRGEFEHLFINRRTRKPYTTITKVWERLRKKAGLPHLRIHDLRHQYASFLVNAGRTLYEVQQILGHSNPSVTTRYAHLSSKSLQEAANSASAAIKGATLAAELAGRPADGAAQADPVPDAEESAVAA